MLLVLTSVATSTSRTLCVRMLVEHELRLSDFVYVVCTYNVVLRVTSTILLSHGLTVLYYCPMGYQYYTTCHQSTLTNPQNV